MKRNQEFKENIGVDREEDIILAEPFGCKTKGISDQIEHPSYQNRALTCKYAAVNLWLLVFYTNGILLVSNCYDQKLLLDCGEGLSEEQSHQLH